jgi:hypothetical protein
MQLIMVELELILKIRHKEQHASKLTYTHLFLITDFAIFLAIDDNLFIK